MARLPARCRPPGPRRQLLLRQHDQPTHSQVVCQRRAGVDPHVGSECRLRRAAALCHRPRRIRLPTDARAARRRQAHRHGNQGPGQSESLHVHARREHATRGPEQSDAPDIDARPADRARQFVHRRPHGHPERRRVECQRLRRRGHQRRVPGGRIHGIDRLQRDGRHLGSRPRHVQQHDPPLWPLHDTDGRPLRRARAAGRRLCERNPPRPRRDHLLARCVSVGGHGDRRHVPSRHLRVL